MGTIRWDEGMRVGIPDMDAEHRALIDDVGALAEAMEAGALASDVVELLDAIEAHLVAHLRTEERWMRATAYPRYVQHLNEHDRFVRILLDWRVRYVRVGPDPDVVVAFHKEVVGWLFQHMERADKPLAEHLRHIEEADLRAAAAQSK